METVEKYHGKLKEMVGIYNNFKLYAGRTNEGIQDKYLVIDSDTFSKAHHLLKMINVYIIMVLNIIYRILNI